MQGIKQLQFSALDGWHADAHRSVLGLIRAIAFDGCVRNGERQRRVEACGVFDTVQRHVPFIGMLRECLVLRWLEDVYSVERDAIDFCRVHVAFDGCIPFYQGVMSMFGT